MTMLTHTGRSLERAYPLAKGERTGAPNAVLPDHADVVSGNECRRRRHRFEDGGLSLALYPLTRAELRLRLRAFVLDLAPEELLTRWRPHRRNPDCIDGRIPDASLSGKRASKQAGRKSLRDGNHERNIHNRWNDCAR